MTSRRSTYNFVQKMKEWNCSEECINEFKENEIDDQSFELLSDSDIREMIKLTGPRNKFLKNFNEYLQLLKNQVAPVTPDITKPDGHGFEYESEGLSNSEASTSVPTSKVPTASGRSISFDSLNSDQWVETTVSEDGQLILDANVINIDKTVDTPAIVQNISNSNLSGSLPATRTSIFPNGLKAHLETNYEGRLALKSGDNLDHISRKHLVRSVVEFLFQNFSYRNVIRREIFLQAFAEIIEVYPNERESVYFVLGKPKTKNTKKTPNAGKLWSRYHNVQRELGGFKEVNHDEIVEEVEDPIIQPNEASGAAYQYLKNNVGTFESQKCNWQLCSTERESYLKNHSIYEYMKLFPALRVQFGFQLILLDFDKKYPSKKHALYGAWEYLSSAVLKLGVKNGDLLETEDDVINDAVVVQYFPQLFKSGTVRNKSKKNNFRPSATELVETVFLRVRAYTDLDVEIERRKKTVVERGDTLQPFLIVIGNAIDEIDSVYVYVDGTRFLMETILQVVDVCFKLYQALDAEYPTTGLICN